MLLSDEEYKLAQCALTNLWWKICSQDMEAENKFITVPVEDDKYCDLFAEWLRSDEHCKYKTKKDEVMELGEKIERIRTPLYLKEVHDIVNNFPYFILRANWGGPFNHDNESNFLITGDGMGMLYTFIDLDKLTCKICKIDDWISPVFAKLLNVEEKELPGTKTSIEALKTGLKQYIQYENEKRKVLYERNSV